MSAAPSYQTVRLSKGRHRSAEEGACVVELASMLNGSRFSDSPYCICPAIRGFLHGYNDHLDDELRQGLYGCAVRVLDTAGDAGVTARRSVMCRTWAYQARSLGVRLPIVLRGTHVRVLWRLRFRCRDDLDALDCEVAGAYAATLARGDPVWQSWTLGFVDALVWLGSSRRSDDFVGPSADVRFRRGGAGPRSRQEGVATRHAPPPLVGAGSGGA